MRPYPRTIPSLFEGRCRYQIPLFQRQYVWTRERQWVPLWEDIESKASAQTSQSSHRLRPHFLGTIVWKPEIQYGEEVPVRAVIDGQQRLTTFQILLAAMRDVGAALSIAKYSTELETYTKNTGEMSRKEVECYKVWPTEGDAEVFTCVMSAKARTEVERQFPLVLVRRKPQLRHGIVEAYLYFYDAIAEYLTSEGSDATTRFSDLFRTLTQQIQLVSLELEEQDDPQVIFETLNARGEPLLASDLLRNFIFVRADRGGENYKTLYATYWKSFDTAKVFEETEAVGSVSEEALRRAEQAKRDAKFFWKIPERQGRFIRPRLDLYFQHFLTMKRALAGNAEEPIPIGHLFPEYQDWIRDAEPYPSVEAELSDLKAKADVFHGFFAPTMTTRMGQFAARLKVLDTSTVYPLLLFLATSDRVERASVDGMLVDIESFLVRRLVCGQTTKNYNRQLLQVLRLASAESMLSRARFQELFSAGRGESVDWPSDDDFRSAWLYRNAYEDVRPRRIEMILRAVNAALTTDFSETGIKLGTLHIEHVMPQKWQEHWTSPRIGDEEGVSADEALARRSRMLHSFGNLTLLTQKLNSSISNGPYETKRSRIVLNSALRLNTYFQDQTTWDDDAILKRGEVLFEVARKVWPRPRG